MNICVKCGFCCKKGPCAFGRWNESKRQCEYLTSQRCKKNTRLLPEEANWILPEEANWKEINLSGKDAAF
jgi:hypothetical protein